MSNELLAEVHEKAMNVLYSAKMSLPDSIHVVGLRGAIEEIYEMTKAAWEEETGQTSVKP